MKWRRKNNGDGGNKQERTNGGESKWKMKLEKRKDVGVK